MVLAGVKLVVNTKANIHFRAQAFRLSEPRDPEIGEMYGVHECCATDFEAPKL